MHRADRLGRVWRDLLTELTDQATFAGPITTGDLAKAADALGRPVPDALSALLLESDGVLGEYDMGLVWPLQRIVDDNLAFRADLTFRELYMPFDPLLFFADAGNGDQFAFVCDPRRDDV